MASCGFIFLKYNALWDEISDTPCLMSPIDDTGLVTVNRFISDGAVVTQEKRAKLSKCRIETPSEIQRANKFLESLGVFDEWVCVALLEDGTFDILYYERNGNKLEVASLNDAQNRYMNDAVPSTAGSFFDER